MAQLSSPLPRRSLPPACDGATRFQGSRTVDGVAELFEPYFDTAAPYEFAMLAGFDARGCLQFWTESDGIRSGQSRFNPRAIRALLGHPTIASVVIAHNHPSGVCTPSDADIAFTREIAALCRACGVHLHDHLIHAHGDWFSFRGDGLI